MASLTATTAHVRQESDSGFFTLAILFWPEVLLRIFYESHEADDHWYARLGAAIAAILRGLAIVLVVFGAGYMSRAMVITYLGAIFVLYLLAAAIIICVYASADGRNNYANG